MKIKRDEYLKELIDSQWDGQIKVITGLRRSGKSYLLKTLFRDYLRRERGVDGGHILVLELDLAKFAAYRNPIKLAERVEGWAKGGENAISSLMRFRCARRFRILTCRAGRAIR